MAVRIIGVTTEVDSIGRMLGSTEDCEYGLVCETEMGKYYAKVSEYGGFEEEYVRLISKEQASELEASAFSSIDSMKQIDAVPVIDMKQFKMNLADIEKSAKKKAKQMGENIKDMLDKAGFCHSYS